MVHLPDQRLAQLIQRHEALASEMSNPALEPSRFVSLSKDYAELTPAADAARAVAAMRRELGITTGDTVLVDVDDGELRVRSVPRALERARAILRKYVPEGVGLADELIAERRREAERE